MDNTSKGKLTKQILVNPYKLKSKTDNKQEEKEFPPYYLVAKNIWHGTKKDAVFIRANEVQCNRKDVDEMREKFAKMSSYITTYKFIPYGLANKMTPERYAA